MISVAEERELQSLYDQMEAESRRLNKIPGKGLDVAFVNAQMLGVRLAADAVGVEIDRDYDRELT